MARTKKALLELQRRIRFFVLVALFFLGLIGYSLLTSLDVELRFKIFIILGTFMLIIFILDWFTPLNLVRKTQVRSLLTGKKR